MRRAIRSLPSVFLLVGMLLTGTGGTACSQIKNQSNGNGKDKPAPPPPPAIVIQPMGPIGPGQPVQDFDLGVVADWTYVYVWKFPLPPANVEVTVNAVPVPLVRWGFDFFAFKIPSGMNAGDHSLQIKDTNQNFVPARATFRIE